MYLVILQSVGELTSDGKSEKEYHHSDERGTKKEHRRCLKALKERGCSSLRDEIKQKVADTQCQPQV
jgi:hypothetical protein